VESNQPQYRYCDPHPTRRDEAGRPWLWCGSHFVSPDAFERSFGHKLTGAVRSDGAVWYAGIWRKPGTARYNKYVRLYGVPTQQPEAAPAPQPVDPQLAAVRARHKTVLAELENQQSGIEEGYVYVVTNPAWPGWVKFGSAIDPESRLRNYQTGSPMRDYKVEGYVYSAQRRATERRILDGLRITDGEWTQMKVDHALAVLDMYCFSQ
jgi:hypothetical protein